MPRLPEARWVEPRIVIRAEFAEWTRDGLLRQAAFKGIEVERSRPPWCGRRRCRPRGSQAHAPAVTAPSAARQPGSG